MLASRPEMLDSFWNECHSFHQDQHQCPTTTSSLTAQNNDDSSFNQQFVTWQTATTQERLLLIDLIQYCQPRGFVPPQGSENALSKETVTLASLTEKITPLDASGRLRLIELVLGGVETDAGYRADNRVFIHQVAHLLGITFEDVSTLERHVLVDILVNSSNTQDAPRPDPSTPVVPLPDRETSAENTRKAWIITGFAAGGAVLLTATGLLIYPMVVGTYSLVGGLVLPATAIAAVKGAGVVAVAVKATTLTSFGLGGAGLGAYKAWNRLAGCDEFRFCHISRVKVPCEPFNKNEWGTEIASGETLGLLVDGDVRNACVTNLISLVEQNYCLGLVLENHTTASLELIGCSFDYGCWNHAPQPTIPSGKVGVCVARNRSWRLTGTTGTLTYKVSKTHMLIIYFSKPLIGASTCGAAVVPLTTAHDVALNKAYRNSKKGPYRAICGGGLEITCFGENRKTLVLEKATAASLRPRVPLVFPNDHHIQTAEDVFFQLHHRQYSVCVIQNKTHDNKTLVFHSLTCNVGTLWEEFPLPRLIPPGMATVFVVTNSSCSVGGADCTISYSIHDPSDIPVSRRRDSHHHVKMDKAADVPTLDVRVVLSVLNRVTVETIVHHPARASKEELATPLVYESGFEVDAHNNVVVTLQPTVASISATLPDKLSVHVTIAISGFMSVHDPRYYFNRQNGLLWHPILEDCKVLGIRNTEGYYLEWETEQQRLFGDLCSPGGSLLHYLGDKALHHVIKHGVEDLAMSTLQTALVAASMSVIGVIRIPSTIVWATGVIDNSFVVLQNRAKDAGIQLASALLQHYQGRRPVTLIAFSTGVNVVSSCLQILAEANALNVVENVYLLGGTILADDGLWSTMRRVVCGRVVNVYSAKDWFLSFLYRANSLSVSPVAGLSRIRSVVGVENVNVSDIVSNHADYIMKLDEILATIPEKPNALSIDPEEELPGFLAPNQKYLKAKVAALHKGLFKVEHRITICLRNNTGTPLKLTTCQFFAGRWERVPLQEIPTSFLAVMSAQNWARKPEKGILGVFVYSSPEVHVVCYLETSTTSDGSNAIVTCAVLDGTVTLPGDLFIARNDVVTQQSQRIGRIEYKVKLRKVPDQNSCVVTLVSSDAVLQANLKAMKTLETWATSGCGSIADSSLHATTVSWSVPASVHAISNTHVVPISPHEKVIPHSRKLEITLRNGLQGFQVTLTKQAAVDARWRCLPPASVPAKHESTFSLAPYAMGDNLSGYVIFDIFNEEIEDLVAHALIAFDQKWDVKVEAKCYVKLFLKGCLPEGISGKDCEGSTMDDDAIVAIQVGRNEGNLNEFIVTLQPAHMMRSSGCCL